ncbi:MAG: hypothetical protein HC809_14995 [Gammaproteobacteria bacterium]|nr:hypothetical protein [Gammaproteobacteria bacterium]
MRRSSMRSIAAVVLTLVIPTRANAADAPIIDLATAGKPLVLLLLGSQPEIRVLGGRGWNFWTLPLEMTPYGIYRLR